MQSESVGTGFEEFSALEAPSEQCSSEIFLVELAAIEINVDTAPRLDFSTGPEQPLLQFQPRQVTRCKREPTVAGNVSLPNVMSTNRIIPWTGCEPLWPTLPADPSCKPIEPAQQGSPRIVNAKNTPNILRVRVILALHTDPLTARERSRNAPSILSVRACVLCQA